MTGATEKHQIPRYKVRVETVATLSAISAMFICSSQTTIWRAESELIWYCKWDLHSPSCRTSMVLQVQVSALLRFKICSELVNLCNSRMELKWHERSNYCRTCDMLYSFWPAVFERCLGDREVRYSTSSRWMTVGVPPENEIYWLSVKCLGNEE